MSGVPPQAADVLDQRMADLVQQQMDEQSAFDAEFRSQQAAMSQKIGAVHDELLRKLNGHDASTAPVQAEANPDILEINQALMKNPLLIPIVKQFINKTINEISDCVQSKLNELLA